MLILGLLRIQLLVINRFRELIIKDLPLILGLLLPPRKERVASSQLVPPGEALKMANSRKSRNFRNAPKQKGSKGYWKNKNKRGK